MDDPTTTPDDSGEESAVAEAEDDEESEAVESAAKSCATGATRWIRLGCCTRTATRRKKQVCVRGAWYWQGRSQCYYPTSYCL